MPDFTFHAAGIPALWAQSISSSYRCPTDYRGGFTFGRLVLFTSRDYGSHRTYDPYVYGVGGSYKASGQLYTIKPGLFLCDIESVYCNDAS